MLGDRLKKLRKEKKLSQEALADALGLERVSISRYETGIYEPRKEQIEKIAEYFNVSTDYLLGLTPYKQPTDDPNLVWGYGALDRDLTPEEVAQVKDYINKIILAHDMGDSPQMHFEQSPAELLAKKYTRIHVYGSVPAGVPTEALEDIVDFEDIPTEWLRGGQEYFGLKVKGDSMYPVYLDGDTIIVRKQPTCESGEDCVVYVNGYEATLKRVQLLPDGLRLQPLNPNYPPQTFTKEEVQALPVGIAGVVVELRRTMKKG